ncbi:hypothetical protein P280DRAFT_522635 [Massarina eburnea CBS 473.64]|uniref:Uncharacterized protein n=1 Tax=Massarina eburnea CBS 473.64 TaxID=1395130 RepID=A0A6A6RMR8_9PLEO|nr:hypothetical protein P280DRAFT_522635 [Massarina eburnea CBS 473.64]
MKKGIVAAAQYEGFRAVSDTWQEDAISDGVTASPDLVASECCGGPGHERVQMHGATAPQSTLPPADGPLKRTVAAAADRHNYWRAALVLECFASNQNLGQLHHLHRPPSGQLAIVDSVNSHTLCAASPSAGLLPGLFSLSIGPAGDYDTSWQRSRQGQEEPSTPRLSST